MSFSITTIYSGFCWILLQVLLRSFWVLGWCVLNLCCWICDYHWIWDGDQGLWCRGDCCFSDRDVEPIIEIRFRCCTMYNRIIFSFLSERWKNKIIEIQFWCTLHPFCKWKHNSIVQCTTKSCFCCLTFFTPLSQQRKHYLLYNCTTK